MHRTIKTASGIAAIATVSLIASAAMANASVTVNPDGTGFIGKGDVQSTLGLNNAGLQKAVNENSLAFTVEQPTSQELLRGVTQTGAQYASQSATQTANQTASQLVTVTLSEDLSCTIVNDNGNSTKTFHREGERNGVREGSRTGDREATREATRDGSRTGERTGTQTGLRSGSVVRGIDVEARKATQYTGFILKGWNGEPTYTETGTPTWETPKMGEWVTSAWSFGNYSFGDYSFGGYDWNAPVLESESGIAWGDWVAEPGENPSSCLRQADHVTDLVDIVTVGDVKGGAITNGAVVQGAILEGEVHEDGFVENDPTYGAIKVSAVTATGTATVFVNGKAIPTA